MVEYSLLEGKKVLLVDDEPDVLDALEDLLPMCEVKKSSNFKAAKDLLENQEFDIAILDIMGVEGYSLLDICVKKNVTAVMLTAHALSPENVVRSYREGAASYLPKEKMVDIVSYLNDILESKTRGEDPWQRWYERLFSYFEDKFKADWKNDQREFWEKFPFY
jgi:DNA-binding NtrC family response regulator